MAASLPPPAPGRSSSSSKAFVSEWQIGQDHADWLQERRTCFLLPLMNLDAKDKERANCTANKNRHRHALPIAAIVPDEEEDLEGQELSPFSQLDYLTHLDWMNKVVAATRLDQIRDGNRPAGAEHYTDADLHQEFFAMYGGMDKSSPMYPKLFATFKESFLETLQELETSEANCERQDPTLESFNDLRRVLTRVNKLYPPGSRKQELYKILDPLRNPFEADWMILPRPRMEWGRAHLESRLVGMLQLKLMAEARGGKDIRGDRGERAEDDGNDSDSSYSNNWKKEEAQGKRFGAEYKAVVAYFDNFGVALKQKLPINIAIMDPKYWNLPLHVFHGQEGTDNFAPRALTYQLNSLIHAYPSGVSAVTLSNLFHRHTGYKMQYGRDQGDYKDIFATMTDVFHILEPEEKPPTSNNNNHDNSPSEGVPLFFPKSFKDFIPSRMIIDMRVTHFIIVACMLEKTGFIQIDTIPALIWKHFGVRIIFSEWGYRSILDFVKDYIRSIDDYTHIVTFWHRKPDYLNLATQSLHVRSYEETYLVFRFYPYVTEDFETYRRDNEDLAVRDMNEHQRNAIRSLLVAKRFMASVEDLSSVSELMSPGGIMDCICLNAESPSMFAVTPTFDMNRLDNLRSILNKEKWRENAQPPNLSRLMALGLPILVKVPSTTEWCRGVVSRVEEVTVGGVKSGGLNIKVRLVDYGREVTVKDLNDIALLPRDLAEGLRTAAVYCKLYFNDPALQEKQSVYDWKREEIKLFEKLVTGPGITLRIILHRVKQLNLFRILKKNGLGASNSPLPPQPEKIVVDGSNYSPDGELYLPIRDSRIWTVSVSVIQVKDSPYDAEDDEAVVIQDLAVEFEKQYNEMKKEKEKEKAKIEK